MKGLLNDFISLIFGKKEYSNFELSFYIIFLILITITLVYLQ